MAAAIGEKYGGLARRIAAADDDNLLAVTELGFEMGSGVVDPRADEARRIVDAQFPVLSARGDDHGPREDAAAIGQHDRIRPMLAAQLLDLAGDIDAGAEFLGLHERAAGERLA